MVGCIRVDEVFKQKQRTGDDQHNWPEKPSEIKTGKFFDQKEAARDDEQKTPENTFKIHGCFR